MSVVRAEPFGPKIALYTSEGSTLMGRNNTIYVLMQNPAYSSVKKELQTCR